MSSYITDAEILGGIGYGNDQFTFLEDDWDTTDKLSEDIPYPPPMKVDYRDPRKVYIDRDREPRNGAIRYDDDESAVKSLTRFQKKEPNLRGREYMTGSKEQIDNNDNIKIMGYSLPIQSQVLWLCLFFIIIIICLQMYNLNKIHKIVKTFVKEMRRNPSN